MRLNHSIVLCFLSFFHFTVPVDLFFTEVRELGSLSQSFLTEIKNVFGLRCFVETGTAGGGTTVRAAQIFDEVHTIELDHDIFNRNKAIFNQYSNIHAYCGDSSRVLKEILSIIKEDACVFFLDAHYDGYSGPQGEVITPILKELREILTTKPNSVILIDDLRLFQREELIQKQAEIYPNLKNLLEGYCSITQIKNLLQDLNPLYEFFVYGDVGLIYLKDRYPSIKPSKVLRTLTKSRFFEEIKNPSIEETLDVINEEYSLIEANSEERAAIFSLLNSQEARYHPELYATHYILWNAWANMGIDNFSEALNLLKKSSRLGMNHWRLQLYSLLAYERQNHVH